MISKNILILFKNNTVLKNSIITRFYGAVIKGDNPNENNPSYSNIGSNLKEEDKLKRSEKIIVGDDNPRHDYSDKMADDVATLSKSKYVITAYPELIKHLEMQAAGPECTNPEVTNIVTSKDEGITYKTLPDDNKKEMPKETILVKFKKTVKNFSKKVKNTIVDYTECPEMGKYGKSPRQLREEANNRETGPIRFSVKKIEMKK